MLQLQGYRGPEPIGCRSTEIRSRAPSRIREDRRRECAWTLSSTSYRPECPVRTSGRVRLPGTVVPIGGDEPADHRNEQDQDNGRFDHSSSSCSVTYVGGITMCRSSSTSLERFLPGFAAPCPSRPAWYQRDGTFDARRPPGLALAIRRSLTGDRWPVGGRRRHQRLWPTRSASGAAASTPWRPSTATSPVG